MPCTPCVASPHPPSLSSPCLPPHPLLRFLRELNQTREEREFIAELSMQMGLTAYVTNERMPIGQLYVLRKGMVVKV